MKICPHCGRPVTVEYTSQGRQSMCPSHGPVLAVTAGYMQGPKVNHGGK